MVSQKNLVDCSPCSQKRDQAARVWFTCEFWENSTSHNNETLAQVEHTNRLQRAQDICCGPKPFCWSAELRIHCMCIPFVKIMIKWCLLLWSVFTDKVDKLILIQVSFCSCWISELQVPRISLFKKFLHFVGLEVMGLYSSAGTSRLSVLNLTTQLISVAFYKKQLFM